VRPAIPSFPPQSRHALPPRHSHEGGNPVLPRRMGPRIREDDKTSCYSVALTQATLVLSCELSLAASRWQKG
jgi:hypothetical protein